MKWKAFRSSSGVIYVAGVPEKKQEDCQDNRSTGRVRNPGPPEYESEVLITQRHRPVIGEKYSINQRVVEDLALSRNKSELKDFCLHHRGRWKLAKGLLKPVDTDTMTKTTTSKELIRDGRNYREN
jgi:hypothetical protein